MNKVVHFEIPVDNLERAKKFYKDAFGWEMHDMPEMDYVLVRTVDVDDETMMPTEPGAINGGIMMRGDVKAPSLSIEVRNLDDALERLEEAGGVIIRGKTPVGDMGNIAYFKDLEGNILSVWEPKRKQ